MQRESQYIQLGINSEVMAKEILINARSILKIIQVKVWRISITKPFLYFISFFSMGYLY